MKLRVHWFIKNILSGFFALIALFTFQGYAGRHLDSYPLDASFNYRGKVSPPKEVLIISIDLESYRKLGLSPFNIWPREKHADLLKKLKSYGVSRVAFDIAFQGKGKDEATDFEFAKALSLNPTIIASDAPLLGDLEQSKIEDLSPEPIFARSVEALGRPGFPIDDDGTIRRLPIVSPRLSQPLRPLSEAAVGAKNLRFGRPSRDDFINFEFLIMNSSTTLSLCRLSF
ncbi:MAG: CHASE2 domain-containing protein [SAR324 cluster bacterium]|uniref:CHASE2 domain-containing protein n=1 Tax=SAR324 cluster bacterium TaxID=2024889 RepID=A0A7X9FPY8_9DELT|nr:CHASE2 domain-containing protein [SAR324 cluster bacterium]